jgi:hypothetical protein
MRGKLLQRQAFENVMALNKSANGPGPGLRSQETAQSRNTFDYLLLYSFTTGWIRIVALQPRGQAKCDRQAEA